MGSKCYQGDRSRSQIVGHVFSGSNCQTQGPEHTPPTPKLDLRPEPKPLLPEPLQTPKTLPPVPARTVSASPGALSADQQAAVADRIAAAKHAAEQARLAAEQHRIAAREKLAAEKSALEKSNAEKILTQKAQAEEKLAAERAAQERAAQARLAQERATADELAAETTAAIERAIYETERAAFQKIAEKLAAEKIASEKIAPERIAPERITAEHGNSEPEQSPAAFDPSLSTNPSTSTTSKRIPNWAAKGKAEPPAPIIIVKVEPPKIEESQPTPILNDSARIGKPATTPRMVPGRLSKDGASLRHMVTQEKKETNSQPALPPPYGSVVFPKELEELDALLDKF